MHGKSIGGSGLKQRPCLSELHYWELLGNQVLFVKHIRDNSKNIAGQKGLYGKQEIHFL